MTKEGFSFEGWLEAAGVSSRRLSEQQLAILQGAFCFLQECGGDFATQRILAHFLLHCHSGLKIAQIGRLVQCQYADLAGAADQNEAALQDESDRSNTAISSTPRPSTRTPPGAMTTGWLLGEATISTARNSGLDVSGYLSHQRRNSPSVTPISSATDRQLRPSRARCSRKYRAADRLCSAVKLRLVLVFLDLATALTSGRVLYLVPTAKARRG